jgi:hypothetical protein
VASTHVRCERSASNSRRYRAPTPTAAEPDGAHIGRQCEPRAALLFVVPWLPVEYLALRQGADLLADRVIASARQ